MQIDITKKLTSLTDPQLDLALILRLAGAAERVKETPLPEAREKLFIQVIKALLNSFTVHRLAAARLANFEAQSWQEGASYASDHGAIASQVAFSRRALEAAMSVATDVLKVVAPPTEQAALAAATPEKTR